MLQSWALLLGICLVAPTSSAYAQNNDWEKIDAAFGRNAVVTADVHRHSFPRSDLPVTLDGVTLKPGFALAVGWLSSRWEATPSVYQIFLRAPRATSRLQLVPASLATSRRCGGAHRNVPPA